MLYKTNYSSRFCERNSIGEFYYMLNTLYFVMAHVSNSKILCNTVKPVQIKTIVQFHELL